MTKFNKVRTAVAILTIPMILVFISPGSTFAATPVIHQGSTSTYAVLAYSTITNTGATTMSGSAGADIGLSPGTSFTNTGTVTTSGSQHITDSAASTAQTDFNTAYTDLNAPTATTLSNPDLAAQVISPGTYSTAAGTFANSGNVTLDAGNDPNAVFIFRAASTVITSTNSAMTLAHGAQACNVYWEVGSSATLGVTSSFIGHIYAQVSITANTGATVKGQLLAHTGAVTLDHNTIVNDNCTTTTTTTTTTPTPCTSVISDVHFTTGGAGATNGKLTWTTSGPGLVQFVGDPSLYPTPFRYGTYTSSWDGSLANMVPGTTYPVSVTFLASCGTTSQASTTAGNVVGIPTPTPTPTPTPVVTPTPTPTPTPTVTPTPVVTPTPTPVVTPTPKPVPTPVKTTTGGKLPKTGTPWYNLLALSAGLFLLGGFGTARKLKRN